MNTLTRDAYAEVGLELLAESGIAAVTIAAVCRRLQVTKGSFYHHFSSVSDLHDAMLEHWENVYGVERPAAIEALPPLQRLDATIDASLDRNHGVESALRAWSHSDDRAAAVQRRLDDRRRAFVTATLAECGVPERRAEVLASMSLAMLVGFQSLGAPVDLHSLRESAELWREHLHALVDQEAVLA